MSKDEVRSLFIGEYRHSLDVKGRIIVPAKFRDGLGEKFVLTKGLDGCLFAYSKEEWANFEEKIKTLPLTNKDARAFVRFFFAGAVECEIDKQGRTLISPMLREYAGLNKDLVIIGVSNRVEIWSQEKWDNYSEAEDLEADDLAEKMALLGI
jgi:MraZ protein